MQKIFALLPVFAIVFAAGCVSQEDLKSVPEVKAFLGENPESSFSAALYPPSKMKEVVQELSSNCPALEESKSYYKVVLNDLTKGRAITVWVDEQTKKTVCIISPPASATTTLLKPDGSPCSSSIECLSGFCINSICNTPGAAGTTTTSTTIPTTTTLQTTTLATTTTTAPKVSNETTTIQTTTTISILPDLTGDISFYEGSSSGLVNFNMTVKNIGQLTSKAGSVVYSIWKDGSNVYDGSGTYNSLGFEESKLFQWAPFYTHASGNYYLNLTIDTTSNTTESNENNNIIIKNYTAPLSTTTTTTTAPTTTTTIPPFVNLNLTSLSVVKGPTSSIPKYNMYVRNWGNQNTNTTGFKLNYLTVNGTGNSTILENYNRTYNLPLSAGYSDFIDHYGIVLAPGTYYIIVNLDYQNQVAESNENDNVHSASFTIPLP